jgi:hypothetical protein
LTAPTARRRCIRRTLSHGSANANAALAIADSD